MSTLCQSMSGSCPTTREPAIMLLGSSWMFRRSASANIRSSSFGAWRPQKDSTHSSQTQIRSEHRADKRVGAPCAAQRRLQVRLCRCLWGSADAGARAARCWPVGSWRSPVGVRLAARGRAACALSCVCHTCAVSCVCGELRVPQVWRRTDAGTSSDWGVSADVPAVDSSVASSFEWRAIMDTASRWLRRQSKSERASLSLHICVSGETRLYRRLSCRTVSPLEVPPPQRDASWILRACMLDHAQSRVESASARARRVLPIASS